MLARHVFALALLALVPLSAPLPSVAATMPACGVSDPVVWVNTSTHVYHRKGDRYYGTTKHGEYACESKAVASGAHASGSGTSATSKKSAMSSPAATPVPADAMDASPAPSKKHHHRAKASPAPDATP